MKEVDRQRAIQEKLARSSLAPAPSLSTGFRTLDAATGGFPRGGIVELFGASGCGKTTLAIQIAARVQAAGGSAVWIDAEHCFDPAYAMSLGAAMDGLPVACPDSAEEALEMLRRLAETAAVDLLIVDSAAALVPQFELEAGIGANSPGLHSRVLGSGLRRLATAIRRSGAVVLFLNHSRARSAGDEDETAAGGPALKLYASLRMAMEGNPARTPVVALRVLKNKTGRLAACELRWQHGVGFTEAP
jgi:recombination protein RecA